MRQPGEAWLDPLLVRCISSAFRVHCNAIEAKKTTTVLIVLLVLFVLGGGGWGYSRFRG
jgi:hypothetical protein